MGRANQLPPDTSVPMLTSLAGMGGMSGGGAGRFAPAFMDTAVPDFTPFREPEPRSFGGLEDIYAQPTDMGRFQQFMQPTPEESRFAELLKQRPTREEYEPSIGRRITSSLVAGLIGAGGDPVTGLRVGQMVSGAPYAEAIRDWQSQLEPAEKLAELAGERRRTGGTLARSIMQNERVIKNQMADNLLNTMREQRLAEQAKNQGWTRVTNELTGEVEFVRPGTGERRSMGQMMESIPEKDDKEMRRRAEDEANRRYRQMVSVGAAGQRQAQSIEAAGERQERAITARGDRPEQAAVRGKNPIDFISRKYPEIAVPGIIRFDPQGIPTIETDRAKVAEILGRDPAKIQKYIKMMEELQAGWPVQAEKAGRGESMWERIFSGREER